MIIAHVAIPDRSRVRRFMPKPVYGAAAIDVRAAGRLNQSRFFQTHPEA